VAVHLKRLSSLGSRWMPESPPSFCAGMRESRRAQGTADGVGRARRKHDLGSVSPGGSSAPAGAARPPSSGSGGSRDRVAPYAPDESPGWGTRGAIRRPGAPKAPPRLKTRPCQFPTHVGCAALLPLPSPKPVRRAPTPPELPLSPLPRACRPSTFFDEKRDRLSKSHIKQDAMATASTSLRACAPATRAQGKARVSAVRVQAAAKNVSLRLPARACSPPVAQAPLAIESHGGSLLPALIRCPASHVSLYK